MSLWWVADRAGSRRRWPPPGLARALRWSTGTVVLVATSRRLVLKVLRGTGTRKPSTVRALVSSSRSGPRQWALLFRNRQSMSHALDAEMFKWVADVLVAEAGVQPMLHRLCVAPILENGSIQGVITESKSGREAILARRVIDATGDADIATRAGAGPPAIWHRRGDATDCAPGRPCPMVLRRWRHH